MRTLSKPLVLVAAWVCALAAPAESLPAVNREQLAGHIAQMESLAAACAEDGHACEPDKIAGDEAVGEPGRNGGYAVHWFWLRTAMTEARTAKADARATLMQDAALRLAEMAQEAGASAETPDALALARKDATAVLAREEFRSAAAPSWLDRLAARFWDFIGSLFNGAARMGTAAPWIGSLLEWVFFLAAATGLGFFVLRALARQRLQVAMNQGPAVAGVWDRESTDWARHAELCAARQDWREALHGLYWASILHLESRRAWRHDASRTPREYVRLLQLGSAQRQALAGLTRLFERVWYGLSASSEPEYRTAHELFERIAASSSTSSAVAGPVAEPGAA